MLYNVSQILREPIGSTRDFPVDDSGIGSLPELGPEFGAKRMSGSVRLLRTHHGLLVYGTVDVEVEASCGRCLDDFARISTLTLEEECYPTVDPATGRRMSPPEESEGVLHVDSRQLLDLSDVLRQYLLTSEPLKSLCRQDCQGLCPECGANLNAEKCRCDTLAIDPRWGALASLLSEG